MDVKHSIVSRLAFFDNSYRTIKLKVDASKYGLGADISANDKIFGYASKALNKREQNYSLHKNELYAIVYAYKHFHHFIYSRKVNVTTDHHTLEAILLKPLLNAPARMQRLMIQFQPYDLSVHYTPGSEISVAVALSHLHLPSTDEELHTDIEVFVHLITNSLPLSNIKI
ncbi:hypothetical protein QYM36_003453 [Artemia franciscana]|uniref:Reverse transcriptase RNase H-like domain-containing protein n=1 Tax=Artemia franciscana TaxID=6661 RepID=A0AA88L7E9_ARTSF|nr:hypothetical protein QYM36_003453 [Artemia franciscana]